MTLKGKAALYQGFGKGFTVEELPAPEVKPGGILVRVTAASICGSDLHYWRGDFKIPPQMLPRIPGHEFTGRVHTLGEGVTTDSLGRPLKEGDRVAFPFFFPCGRCFWCARGEMHACPDRMRPSFRLPFKEYPYCDGGFAQFFYIQPRGYVFKVPDELPDEAVAPVNCALAQVIFGLHRAGVDFGDNVVVQGAGGLGIYATAVAREMGAGQVISIDGQPARLELARRCGATHTININEVRTPEERVKLVRELTGGRGADVVVEVTGVPQAIPEGLAMVRTNGKYVEIGNVTSGTLELPNVFTGRQVRLFGTAHYNPWVIGEALDFLVQTRDRYALLDLPSHRFPLERINEAFETAEWVGKETPATRVIVNP